MSDNDIIPGVIAAAIAAAGPRGDNEAAWRAKINSAIPAIAAMMNPPEKDAKGSKQWQVASEVLGATVFTAEYVSHTIEEAKPGRDASTRVVVQLDSGKPSKNYPDGVEPIRTHRTDGAQGKAMLAKLEQLTPGDSVVVWKAMEAMSGAAAGEKARVLVHLETRPKWKRDENMTPAPARKAPPANVDRDTGEVAAESGFAYAFNELGSKDKVAVVRILRDEGITFPEPQPDKTDRFLAVIDEVTK